MKIIKERLEKEQLEKVGAAFSEAKILAARRRGWEALHTIRARFHPGLSEEEGLAIAQETLRAQGSHKMWHRPHVRFGCNTLLPFSATSQPGIVLQPNDVFFLDIGPIFDGFEADCGATFQLGRDPDHARCLRDGRAIFAKVKNRWREDQLTGEALYRFARIQAELLGWILTVDCASGHRLSDFPHAIHFKGGISELDFAPAAHRWVLEIQIRHPRRDFGAFFEDLLVEEAAESPFAKPAEVLEGALH